MDAQPHPLHAQNAADPGLQRLAQLGGVPRVRNRPCHLGQSIHRALHARPRQTRLPERGDADAHKRHEEGKQRAHHFDPQEMVIEKESARHHNRQAQQQGSDPLAPE